MHFVAFELVTSSLMTSSLVASSESGEVPSPAQGTTEAPRGMSCHMILQGVT